MATYSAGEAKVTILPSTQGFLRQLRADLSRMRDPGFEVRVTADVDPAERELGEFRRDQERQDVDVDVDVATGAASVDMERWRKTAGRDLHVKVDVDVSQANRQVQELSKGLMSLGRSDFLKINLGLAGISALPAAAAGIAEVAAAAQQLAQVGLVIPGALAAAGASVGTLKLGMLGLEEAFEASGKSAEEFDAALQGLAPSAQAFVKEAVGLKAPMMELRNLVQENVFAGLDKQLKGLVDKQLPTVTKGLDGISKAWNENFDAIFESIGSDEATSLLDRILGNTADAQSRISKAIDPLVDGIGTLAAAGTDALPRLADAFTGVAERFANFITEADQDGRLAKWIDDGITAVGNLGETALNVGKMFTAITGAAGGTTLLADIENLTTKWQTFLNSTEGQNMLKDFFAEGKRIFEEWKPILMDLPGLFKGIYDGAQTYIGPLLDILRPITNFMSEHPKLVEGAVVGYASWATIAGVTGLIGNLGKITDMVGVGIPTAAGKAGGSLDGLGAKLAKIAAPITIAVTLDMIFDVNKDDFDPTKSDWGHILFGDLGDWLKDKVLPESTDPTPGQAPGKTPGPVWRDPSGNVIPQDQLQPNPQRLPPRASGGPTPHGRGPGPTGGWPAEIHADEWILPAHARQAVGDQALWALTSGGAMPLAAVAGSGRKGEGKFRPGDPTKDGGHGWHTGIHGWFGGPNVDLSPALQIELGILGQIPNRRRIKKFGVPGFQQGGFIDEFGNPITPGAAPGPVAPVAPNPTAGGGIGDIVSSFAQGLGGPIGNLIQLGQAMSPQQQGGEQQQTQLTGPAAIPGFIGLANIQSNPDPAARDAQMKTWTAQTAQWAANFGGKMLGRAADTLIPAALSTFDWQQIGFRPSALWGGTYMNAATSTLDHFTNLQQSSADSGAPQDGSGTPEASAQAGIDAVTARMQAQASTASAPTATPERTSGGFKPAAPGGGSGADRWRPVVRQALREIGGQYGITNYAAWENAIIGQIKFESGGNPNALNPNDSDGLPAIGLGQFKRGTFNAHNVTGGSINDGTAQIYAMIDYVAERYGQNSAGVPNFINQGHGYDRGGFIPPGLSLAVNRTGKPEPVLTADQGKAVQAIAKMAAVNPTPPRLPRGPDAQQLIPRPAPQPQPAPVQPTPTQPVPPPAQLVPPQAHLGTGAPPGPPPGPAGAPTFAPGPGGAVAPPGPTDYTLPWINKAIESGAAAIGNATAAAATFGMGGGGGMGGMISGLFAQGGKIVQGVANVVSASLVGSVPGSFGGEHATPYGATLRPDQNMPATAQGGSRFTQYGPFNGHDTQSVMQEINLHESIHQQAAFAAYPGRV